MGMGQLHPLRFHALRWYPGIPLFHGLELLSVLAGSCAGRVGRRDARVCWSVLAGGDFESHDVEIDIGEVAAQIVVQNRIA